MKALLNNLKERLTTGWDLLRWVRLALAVAITTGSWSNSEVLFTVLGSYLTFQALFNYGGCGSTGCNIDQRRVKLKTIEQASETTTFEEVK